MNKYRKLPVVVEAMQFTDKTKDIVYTWITCNHYADWEDGNPILVIQTLEGEVTVRLGDWVIKGVEGEFYPCKPNIFAKTYEPERSNDDKIMREIESYYRDGWVDDE